jgi:helix-turn-helix protein
MGYRNVSGLQIVITEHPVTDDISGNGPPSTSRVIHSERGASKYQKARTGSSGMVAATKRNAMQHLISPLPALRFEISEASRILRMSRAHLYHRIGEGAIRIQKDGTRTYITMSELERYVETCAERDAKAGRPTT